MYAVRHSDTAITELRVITFCPSQMLRIVGRPTYWKSITQCHPVDTNLTTVQVNVACMPIFSHGSVHLFTSFLSDKTFGWVATKVVCEQCINAILKVPDE